MTAIQSSIGGHFSGNNHSNNTNNIITNNYGIQVPSYVPETFGELIRCAGWGVLPPEIDLDHLHDEYNRPCGDTGKWIFEEAVFRRWRETGGSKLLWLCGGPGTGKTMLAKRVAAELLRGPDHLPEGVKLAFHFVSPELSTAGISSDEAASSQLKLAKIAGDLLYTILQQDGSLFDGCKAELERQGDRFFTNQCSLWKVLRKAIKDCRTDPVYILVDGINGLKESLCKELIGRVLELMKIRTVKIFLSSRNVPHISNNLPRNPYRCIKLDLDMNSFIKEDVESFIRYRVNAWGWDADFKEKAMKALLVKSGGIFLWASLAIENLTYFSSGPDFENFLRKPPSGLQDVYRDMLSTLISRGESGEVLNMIWSVALALRPLTFGELAHILACIEEKTRSKQQPSFRETTSRIHPRSEREIKIYVRSSLGFLRTTAETVYIVHHTATEYLFDEYNKGSLPLLSKSETDLALSWECFRYLHHVFGDPQKFSRSDITGGHDGPRGSTLGGDHLRDNRGVTPWEVACRNPQRAADQRIYLRYAAESWFIHARRSIEASGDRFCNSSDHDWLQHQFFETSDIIRRPWIELCGDSRMEVLAGEQTALNIAVCLGLMPLVEKALSDSPRGANSNWSPLHLAARFISGAYEILIAKGGPSLLTDSDKDGNTPLHEAAISGHLPMLKALVKEFTRDRAYSNEINKKNHSGNTALHLAFQFDHTEIVKLLVNKGADTTIKNNAQMTASELGAKLNRRDSLDMLKQAEEMRGVASGEEGPVEEQMGEAVGDLGGIPWACPTGSLPVLQPGIQPLDWMEFLLGCFLELWVSGPPIIELTDWEEFLLAWSLELWPEGPPILELLDWEEFLLAWSDERWPEGPPGVELPDWEEFLLACTLELWPEGPPMIEVTDWMEFLAWSLERWPDGPPGIELPEWEEFLLACSLELWPLGPPGIELVDWIKFLLTLFPELWPSGQPETPWVSSPESTAEFRLSIPQEPQPSVPQEPDFLSPSEPWLPSSVEPRLPSPAESRLPTPTPSLAQSIASHRSQPTASRSSQPTASRPSHPEASRPSQLTASRLRQLEALHLRELEASHRSQLEASRLRQLEASHRSQPEGLRRSQPETSRRSTPEPSRRSPPEASRRSRPETSRRSPPETSHRSRPEASRRSPPETSRRSRPETSHRSRPETSRRSRRPHAEASQRPRAGASQRPRAEASHGPHTKASQGPPAEASQGPRTKPAKCPPTISGPSTITLVFSRLTETTSV